MKKKTLPAAALKNLHLAFTAPVVAPVVEPDAPVVVLSDTGDVPVEPVVVAPVVDDSVHLAEIITLKESLSSAEEKTLSQEAVIAKLEADAVTDKDALTNSEKLVTNLSANLLGVVNSMKTTMGHMELGEEVQGEALLKEYEFTLAKYVTNIPSGSVTEEPTDVSTTQPLCNSAEALDYKNIPWSN